MDVLQAIRQHYTASPTLAMAGGLWLDVAPEDTPLPYGVLVEVSLVPTDTTSTGSMHTQTLQLSIYAASSTDAVRLRGLWSRGPEGLDYRTLSTSPDAWVALERINRRLRVDPDPAPDGSSIWIADLDYTAEVGRTLS
jgi:hypothetical protein